MCHHCSHHQLFGNWQGEIARLPLVGHRRRVQLLLSWPRHARGILLDCQYIFPTWAIVCLTFPPAMLASTHADHYCFQILHCSVLNRMKLQPVRSLDHIVADASHYQILSDQECVAVDNLGHHIMNGQVISNSIYSRHVVGKMVGTKLQTFRHAI
jgi:hypothetical protein